MSHDSGDKRGGWLLSLMQGGFLSAVVMVVVLFVASTVSCNNSGAPRIDVAPILPDGGFGPTCDAEPNKWQGADADITPNNDAGLGSNLFAIWGVDENAMWAVGANGRVVHWNGSSWSPQATPTTVTLTSVWGTSDKDVWASGFGGVVLHYDGTAWTDKSPPTDVFMEKVPDAGAPTGDAGAALRVNLWGIWARGRDDQTTTLYAVGDDGTILHYSFSTQNGEVWARVESGVLEKLTGVWGANDANIFIVGNFGVALKGSASAGFERQGFSDSVDKPLRAVWGRNANDVYAVGLGGTILHYRGGSAKWTVTPGAPPQFLRSIWGPPNNRNVHYIVGWDGVILRMKGRPPNVTFDKFNCVTSQRLEAIWGTLVDGPFPDGGADAAPLDSGADAPPPQIPAVWAVGASGYVLTGP
jgi:hypothetical protein